MTDELSRVEFDSIFPDEDACLNIIFEKRYGKWKNVCPDCYKRSQFYKVNARKCFACQRCGFQVHPLANTIYHKSATPLKTWFYAIYLFARNNRISAKELQRMLNISYKTAWRMLDQIKQVHDLPEETPSKLIEINAEYIRKHISRLHGK